MKNIKLILAVFTVLTFTGFTTLNAQTIALTSKGEVEVIPDIASTNISISKTNKDVEVLKKEILDLSRELNNKLAKLKIDKKDIQTSNIQINKEYDWMNSKKVFKGYSASINTKVTFRDIKNLEKMYTQLLNNEDVTVSGIQYDYSKMEEAENDAYVNALKKANALADRLITETGFKSKLVLSISNNGSTVTTPKPMMYAKSAMMADMESAPSVDINSGTMIISKSLTIVYQTF